MNKASNWMVLLTVALVVTACGRSPAERAAAASAEVAPPTEQPGSAPSGPADKYEGRVVRRAPEDGSKQDGWFFVKDGKRRWIVEASWLDSQGLTPQDIVTISAADLSAIPEDPEPLGASGE